jgi:ABC-type transport system involved in cytochrome c biogenesis permease subunit
VTAFTLILYAVAAVLYAVHFARRDPRAGRAATITLAAAVLTHTFLLGMHTMQVGHAPLVGRGEAVSFFIWLLAVLYLYVEMTTTERAMGVFVVSLLALLFVIPMTSSDPTGRPPLLDTPLFVAHVTFVLVSYASYALASVLSITYLLLLRELKRKRPGVFFARLPPLRTLDSMNVRAVTVGSVFLTISLLIGIIWISQARASGHVDPRVQEMSIADPKILMAVVTWALYAFQLYARQLLGWGGRRAAWLSVAGFASILVNMLPIAYFFQTSHIFD